MSLFGKAAVRIFEFSDGLNDIEEVSVAQINLVFYSGILTNFNEEL